MVTRKEQKAATRVRVMEAARRAFANRAVAEVTVAEVADEAGIAAGTLYVHFAGKEALVDALADDLNEELQEDLRRAFAESEAGDAEGLVADVSRAYLRTWRRYSPLVDVFADRMRRQASAKVLHDGTNVRAPESVAGAFDQVFAMLGIRHDPIALARGLNGLWRSLALRTIERPPEEDEAHAELLAEATNGVLARVAPGLAKVPVAVLRQLFASFFGRGR